MQKLSVQPGGGEGGAGGSDGDGGGRLGGGGGGSGAGAAEEATVTAEEGSASGVLAGSEVSEGMRQGSSIRCNRPQ